MLSNVGSLFTAAMAGPLLWGEKIVSTTIFAAVRGDPLPIYKTCLQVSEKRLEFYTNMDDLWLPGVRFF